MADIALVRRLLREDPFWSLYALGDLDPRREGYCDWYVHGRSVALLYREFGTPILFAAGTPDVLAGLPDVEACLLQLPEAFLGRMQERFELDWTCSVLRMTLHPSRFAKDGARTNVEPLDATHESQLRELFEDGRESREEPDFFMSSQLGDGTFFGVREDGRLVAAGGTHLYSAAESVGAIGNVYTRRSHRGRGHAAAVMATIVDRLLERETKTIGLNVRAANAGAIRLYERLGFSVHTRFFEGRAVARASGSGLQASDPTLDAGSLKTDS